jgi:anti-sigma B factor antagonist
MKHSMESVKGITIFRLKDERLDSTIASDVKAQLLLLLREDGKAKVLVDLTSVKYADSSGLGALLLGLRQARDMGNSFAIYGAQKRVINLLRIAHLEDVLINYDTEAAALKALK